MNITEKEAKDIVKNLNETKQMKNITITKVVSRNFIMDFVARFQNMVGSNLTSYEKMVERGMDQIREELKLKEIKLEWYRFEITQLTNGAISITLYGDQNV